MAIKKDEITTDITLELDEEVISIADFKSASDSFLDLVKEVSKQVSDKKIKDTDWQVKVYDGSIGIGLSANNQNTYSELTIKNIVEGINELTNGFRPALFTDKAIESAKALAQLFKSKKAISPNVRIWDKTNQSVAITRKVADVAKELLEAHYQEDGAVDGILERVDAHGKLEFRVYDLLDNRPIKCEIKESQEQEALANFRKRVEVIGVVKYRKDGLPVSIKANRIVKFPDKSEIPSLLKMREIFARKSIA